MRSRRTFDAGQAIIAAVAETADRAIGQALPGKGIKSRLADDTVRFQPVVGLELADGLFRPDAKNASTSTV